MIDVGKLVRLMLDLNSYARSFISNSPRSCRLLAAMLLVSKLFNVLNTAYG